MSIAALLFSLPSTVTSALLPEVSLRPAERRLLLRRSAYLITAIVVPALIIAFALAPYGLALFGRSYVTGTLTPLRWLIFAGLITMLNYVTGAILFIAKKSTMITIVNVVDAVIVLGLVTLWATNVTQIAIAWLVGDVGNTLLFGFFALVALRQVGGRWEDLGGSAAPAPRRPPASLSATSQLRALGMLATLAEQQDAVGRHVQALPQLPDRLPGPVLHRRPASRRTTPTAPPPPKRPPNLSPTPAPPGRRTNQPPHTSAPSTSYSRWPNNSAPPAPPEPARPPRIPD